MNDKGNLIKITPSGKCSELYRAAGNITALCWYTGGIIAYDILFDMTKQFGTLYLSAMLYENGVFVYAELDSPAIHFLDLNKGKELLRVENRLVLRGLDFVFYTGNVFCRGYKENGESELTQVFLPDL